MSVWSLLGFGTNWDRVNKMQEEEYLYNIAWIIFKITHLRVHKNMEAMINDTSFGVKQLNPEFVYKVIKAFGKELPNKTEYNKFNDYSSTSDLVPSARQVRKNEHYQENWDIAYKWAMEYEKTRHETIIAEKDQKIKELEEKIQKLEVDNQKCER